MDWKRTGLGLAVLASAGTAPAQQDGAQRAGFTLVPTLSVTQTLTDAYRGDGGGPESSESVTAISPGLRLSGRNGALQGSLDYALSGVLHARDSQANSLQHRLAAAGVGELVQNHLDLRMSASISRQPTSAFGRQSVDGSQTDRNQSEVRNLSLQPVLRGMLGGVVSVQASANASLSDGGSEVGSRTHGGVLTLTPARAGTGVSGSVTASRQLSDYDGGRETTNDRVVGTVTITPNPELQFALRGGQERTDIASVERRRYDNWGAGVTWTPGPRTRVVVDGDRRYFGGAHTLSLEHRMQRSVWRYTDTRAVNDGSNQAAGGTVRAYDLFFELFASQEPDPVLRDALVRSFLERSNIGPDTLLGGGFLTSAASVERRQELSLALNGLRTTWVLSAFSTDTRRVDTVSGASDDLADGPVRQRGLSVTVSHRLTPVSGLSLSASMQRSRSDAAGQRNGLDSVTLGWNTRLGPRGNLSLGLRHAEYDDVTEPYTENAITGAFSMRF